MESPFKTPSKMSIVQSLPSSGSSSSPFTPKRSRIKRKSNEEFDSVSRILTFDDSNSRSPFNRKLEFAPLSQQATLCIGSECVKSEPTTPVKTPQTFVESNNKILLSPSIKNRPNRYNIPDEEKNHFLLTTSKRSGSNNSTPSKRIKTNIMENCKPITYYFKPTQKTLDFSSNRVKDINQIVNYKSNEENVSPKIENLVESKFSISNVSSSKSKIFNLKLKKTNFDEKVTPIKSEHINDDQSSKQISIRSSHQNNKSPPIKSITSPQPNKTVIKSINDDGQITPSKNGSINNSPLRSPKIIELLKHKVHYSGGDTYSRFLKQIVLKGELFILGKNDIMTKIENCTDDELKIYGRLISRKHGWIRSNGPDGLIKYKEKNLCSDFDGVLMSLATKQLIDTDVSSCELDCLLNTLNLQELKKLQKQLNTNSSKIKTKQEMIKSFINLVKNQRTLCGNSANNLKERVKTILGCCIKLSDSSRDDIMSCIIYDSYPYFIGEEKDRFRDCLSKFSLVEKGELKFPKYDTKRVSPVFSSKDSLDMYKIALDLRHEVQSSIEQKNNENIVTVLKIMFDKFKEVVYEKHVLDEYSKIPTYMRKYTAISVYAHTLFKNIPKLKKCADKDLAKDVLEFLLKHNNFLMSKQANLHIELARVFETQYKQLDTAAKVILDGLKDDNLSELGRQMLSTKAVMYANRKIRKLDDQLKKELLNVTLVTKKPPTTTISGQIISNSEKVSGRKQVYSKRVENGDIHYMSVEELALSHYKSLGYLDGIHDEGQLIKSMFLLCFWDIIYNSYPPHVLFISEYQDCPLDWRTRHFYSIREQQIKERIAELKQMNVDQVCDMLKVRSDEHFNTQSVINWKLLNVDNLPQYRTLLMCLGIDIFLAIGEQILKDGRIYLHGMPDLIVWDAIKHKCKFVEVKGPNDKLSERQHSWLLKLIDFGADVEVCLVIGTGGKNNNSENIDCLSD